MKDEGEYLSNMSLFPEWILPFSVVGENFPASYAWVWCLLDDRTVVYAFRDQSAVPKLSNWYAVGGRKLYYYEIMAWMPPYLSQETLHRCMKK